MKKAIAIAVLLSLTGSVFADQYVRGHVRKDGTYVQPHYRTAPDSNQFNNYSHQGNSNPYTGQRGNEPYQYQQPRYYEQTRTRR